MNAKKTQDTVRYIKPMVLHLVGCPHTMRLYLSDFNFVTMHE